MKKLNRRQLVREYCARFPSTGNKPLARLLRKDHPKLFKDVEEARYDVRHVRGVAGDGARKSVSSKTLTDLYQPPRPHCSFDRLPEPKSHFEDWGATLVATEGTVLVLCDIHLPYHDRNALQVALEHASKRKIDCILLNGDLVDHYAVSFWESDPRKRDFKNEVDSTKAFFSFLRDLFPDARLVWKDGNHEERFERYMRTRAPELLGLENFEPEAVYDLNSFRVQRIGEMRPVKIGKLLGLHGHEYRFPIANPVNPARGLFLRAKVNSFCGHFHQSSQHSESNLKGEVVSTFSVGSLCNIHPDYRPLNNWNHGFAYVELSAGGAFEFQNHRIVDGKVY